VNSGKLLTGKAVDNPEPEQLLWCNDYPEREYTQASGSAKHPEMDKDIVCSYR